MTTCANSSATRPLLPQDGCRTTAVELRSSSLRSRTRARIRAGVRRLWTPALNCADWPRHA
jgi:hypothetical protein